MIRLRAKITKTLPKYRSAAFFYLAKASILLVSYFLVLILKRG
jgi:hypothetical protein